MPFDAELLDDLIRDSGARWSVTVFATTLVLMVLQLIGAPKGVELGAVTVVAVIGSAGLRLRWRLATAIVCWALATGFAYNRFGLLTFTKSDLIRMGILLAATSLTPSLLGLPRNK
ncbi:MAG: hypothetical protein ACJ71Z_00335 [Aeromicrobium sp.]